VVPSTAVPLTVPSRQRFGNIKNGRQIDGRCRHGNGWKPYESRIAAWAIKRSTKEKELQRLRLEAGVLKEHSKKEG
jgi:biotin-(acetyl-CoA carboxylase) ligase